VFCKAVGALVSSLQRAPAGMAFVGLLLAASRC
jgi:hypothetical protein